MFQYVYGFQYYFYMSIEDYLTATFEYYFELVIVAVSK